MTLLMVSNILSLNCCKSDLAGSFLSDIPVVVRDIRRLACLVSITLLIPRDSADARRVIRGRLELVVVSSAVRSEGMSDLLVLRLLKLLLVSRQVVAWVKVDFTVLG